MERGAKSVKAKVEAGPTVTRKSRKVDGSTGLQLKQRLSEALDQHAAISEILQVMSASPGDVQPVLDAVAKRAAHLCKAPLARVLLVDGDVLRAMAVYSLDGTTQPRTVPVAVRRTTINGRAVVDRATIHHDDVVPLLDSEYPDAPNARQLGLRAVLAVPLIREGTAYGSIFLWRREPGLFSPEQVALVQTFAQQAAIAVDNVRLFNETKEGLEQQRSISEILRVISNSPTDVQPVLDTVAERALNLCDAAHAVIGLVEGTSLRFVAGFGSARDAVGEVVPLDRGLVAGRAVLDCAPIHIADLAQVSEDDYPAARKMQARIGHHTVLAVPLMREVQAIGVIALWRMEIRPFSDKEIWLVKTFSDQAAIAIDNVRLFREIQDKSRQLETASRHKSEFLANMSHELRTPLNAIIGFSEVLSERMFGEVNDKQAEYLNDILESGRHLLSLINDILDLSKIEAGRMELEPTDFDLPSAIENALTLVKERAHRRGIALVPIVDEQLGMIHADERKVKQVVLNLLSNALKFTPEGGQIDVRARMHDGEAEISVTDTGVGIAPEDQAVVFEEFRQVGTASKKVEGTGLGLSISRRFIELHGGRIWVKSQVGAGATFTFTLPL